VGRLRDRDLRRHGGRDAGDDLGDGEDLMHTSQAIGLIVAVILFVYFVVAMVRPERF